MDRSKLKQFLSGRIKPIRPDGFTEDLHIRKISVMEKAEFTDRCRLIGDMKQFVSNNPDGVTELEEKLTSFLLAKSLVDEHGVRLYSDDELDGPILEFTKETADEIIDSILDYSNLRSKDAEEALKNSEPTPSESSSSDSPAASDGGM